jgi:hypothetical protein
MAAQCWENVNHYATNVIFFFYPRVPESWILNPCFSLRTTSITRGSFQKFCKMCFFSLKMNLFYKVHLDAFNIISIVLYHSGPTHILRFELLLLVRGSFQKFCKLCVFSLKIILLYKVHLHAVNIISIVLYHSGPTFRSKSFISVMRPSLLMRLITQATSLDTSSMLLKRFPRSGFIRNNSKSGGLSPPDFELFPKLKKPLRAKRFRNTEEVFNEVTYVIRHTNNEGVQTGIQELSQTLDHCDKAQWRLYWKPVNLFCKIDSFLKRKHTLCRTF